MQTLSLYSFLEFTAQYLT